SAYRDMNFFPVCTTWARIGNLLLGFNHVPFLHQQLVVVCVCTEVGFVMFSDEQLAVAAQSASCVHDLARGCCKHRLSQIAADINTLVESVVAMKPGKDSTLGWPLPIKSAS